MSEIRVNGERLWNSIMEMGKIAETPNGGSGRLALTDDDKQGRDLFVSWCKDAGCEVSVDDLGNIFARRPGRDNTLAPVVAGSHLDTQPHGGKFDGVYGVLSALEVVRALNDHGIETEAPVEIVDWTNEEGSRFSPAMIASGVFASLFAKDFALSRTDKDGNSIGDELRRIGYAGDEPCGARKLGALFEAHIEQGPILEKNKNTVGIVLGAQGVCWYDVTVKGQDSHSGSTPMAGRRDALVLASLATVAVREIAEAYAPDAVATVGFMQVSPNSRNTIPGQVLFTVDLRHPDDAVLEKMDRQLRDDLHRLAGSDNMDIVINQIWHNPAVYFDKECIDAVRQAAQSLGYPHQDIVSGAGHDACQVCRVAPTAMIFVPCADGLSHNEAESATPEDLEAGCNVLLHAMLSRAGKVLGSEPNTF